MSKRLTICFVLFFTTSMFSQQNSEQKLNSIDSTADLTYFNSRPLSPNAFCVLFIGDSLTYHAQTPGVWDYTSGMAATNITKDFVHLSAAHIQQKLGARPVEVLVNNGGNGRIGPMLHYLTHHPEFKPSLVVMQGGENDKFDEAFQATYRSLLDFYKAQRVPYIVLGDWWKGDKSAFDEKETKARNYGWVDLTVFAADKSMSGDPGPYNLPAVAKHPNDNGMKAIATAIDQIFDTKILPAIQKPSRTRRQP